MFRIHIFPLPPATRRSSNRIPILVLVLVLVLVFNANLPTRAAIPTVPQPAEPNETEIVVNTTLDNNEDDGLCSLREAILTANNNSNTNGCVRSGSGADRITFDLGPGVQTITLLQALPAITGQVIIDGADTDSQRTEITGGGATFSSYMFYLHSNSGGSQFRNLILNNYMYSGGLIYITVGNVVLENNWIGLDQTGQTATPMQGTLIGLFGNTGGFRLGGADPVQGNRISADYSSGGTLLNAYEAGSGIIQNNYFGLNADGTALAANKIVDAIFLGKTSGWQVKNNVIAGVNRAIALSNGFNPGGGSHVVQGNLIGTDAAGAVCLGVSYGIHISASSNNQIGGAEPGQGNVIACTKSLGYGFYNEDRGWGIRISSDGFTMGNNRVQGNLIGVAADGITPFSIQFEGIEINTGSGLQIIGGLNPGEGNLIANTGAHPSFATAGIFVESGYAQINGNRIYNTDQTAINLNVTTQNSNGVTRNDTLDGDAGPNNGQNMPYLTTYVPNGSGALVFGVLHSEMNRTYRIELFSNDSLHPSFFGAAQYYLGAVDATTDANGEATFVFDLPVAPAAGSFLAATATNLNNGYTSELSLALPVGGDLVEQLVFQSNRDGDYDLYTINPDGSGLTNQTQWRDTPNQRDERRANWAWGNQRLLFDSNRRWRLRFGRLDI